MRQLSGSERSGLNEVMRAAFTLQRFRELLSHRLEMDLESVALGDDYRAIMFRVIQAAEMEGWTPLLIGAARESNPANARLQEFAEGVGLASRVPAELNLERMLREGHSMLDPAAWRSRLGRSETQVCRVEIPTDAGEITGTGFLVGPDLVVTNYHVFQPVIADDAISAMVAFRFDYKVADDGTEVNPGTVVRLAAGLAADWLVDCSPPSSADAQVAPTHPASVDELDFALLRLSERIGDQPVDLGATSDSKPRGWMDLTCAREVNDNEIIFILQHPVDRPLQLDFATVQGFNVNRTRMRHGVNTLRGSSGSPCLSRDLELVAIHHARRSKFRS